MSESSELSARQNTGNDAVSGFVMGYSFVSSPEAELPRIEPNVDHETFVAGYTPTRTGNWIGSIAIRQSH